jgi:hypothetical protein
MKKNTDEKETETLAVNAETENKTLVKEFEKKTAPIIKGIAKFEKDRTIQKALTEKVVVIKDLMSEKRLKEVYDATPTQYRNPQK